MPKRPASTMRRAQAELHARIAKMDGFRPKDLRAGESPSQVAGLLRALETRGLVLFITGTGWIDSSPALRRAAGDAGDLDAVERLNRFLGLAE